MIKLVSCNNPQWANAEKTELYADIEWDVVGRVHRTHLDPRDPVEHVVSVMADIKALFDPTGILNPGKVIAAQD